jgi:hypothetical protein
MLTDLKNGHTELFQVSAKPTLSKGTHFEKCLWALSN